MLQCLFDLIIIFLNQSIFIINDLSVLQSNRIFMRMVFIMLRTVFLSFSMITTNNWTVH